MSDKPIRRLKIANFKSIDALEITDLSPFSVFAGANGSGKSNFFDALDFVSLFLHVGIRFALNTHGGFANIHSVKRQGADSKKFCFEIEYDLCEDQAETPSTFQSAPVSCNHLLFQSILFLPCTNRALGEGALSHTSLNVAGRGW